MSKIMGDGTDRHFINGIDVGPPVENERLRYIAVPMYRCTGTFPQPDYREMMDGTKMYRSGLLFTYYLKSYCSFTSSHLVKVGKVDSPKLTQFQIPVDNRDGF